MQPTPIQTITLATAVALAGCQATPPRSPVVTQSIIQGAPIIVHAWLTTGDQSRLLAQDADGYTSPDTARSIAAIPLIDVDETRTYQQIIGFG